MLEIFGRSCRIRLEPFGAGVLINTTALASLVTGKAKRDVQTVWSHRRSLSWSPNIWSVSQLFMFFTIRHSPLMSEQSVMAIHSDPSATYHCCLLTLVWKWQNVSTISCSATNIFSVHISQNTSFSNTKQTIFSEISRISLRNRTISKTFLDHLFFYCQFVHCVLAPVVSIYRHCEPRDMYIHSAWLGVPSMDWRRQLLPLSKSRFWSIDWRIQKLS